MSTQVEIQTQDCSYSHSTDTPSYTSVLWGDSKPSQEAGHLASLAAEETLPLAVTLSLQSGLAPEPRPFSLGWAGLSVALKRKTVSATLNLRRGRETSNLGFYGIPWKLDNQM